MRERGGVEVGKDNNNIMFSIALLPTHRDMHLFIHFIVHTSAIPDGNWSSIEMSDCSCGASNSGRSGISSSRSSCM